MSWPAILHIITLILKKLSKVDPVTFFIAKEAEDG